jgi:hypothetical protein
MLDIKGFFGGCTAEIPRNKESSNNGSFAVFGKNRHYFGKNCGKNRINIPTTAIHGKNPHRQKYFRGVLL